MNSLALNRTSLEESKSRSSYRLIRKEFGFWKSIKKSNGKKKNFKMHDTRTGHPLGKNIDSGLIPYNIHWEWIRNMRVETTQFQEETRRKDLTVR